MLYPPQVKPLDEPQLLPDDLETPTLVVPKETAVEIFLRVSLLSHFGQAGI
jgi:hypothetical protein